MTDVTDVTVAGNATKKYTNLNFAGIEFAQVNIWEDVDAAAFVRSVARGNETVPTVSIGAVALVNPSAKTVRQILDEARA